MSDASAILLGHIAPSLIVDTIAAAFPQKLDIAMRDCGNDMHTLRFQRPSDSHLRTLWVFTNNATACDYEDVYKGDATRVSLNVDADSELVMSVLLNRFGGYLRLHEDAEYMFCPVRDPSVPTPSDQHRFDAALREAAHATVDAFKERGFVEDASKVHAVLERAMRELFPTPPAAASAP